MGYEIGKTNKREETIEQECADVEVPIAIAKSAIADLYNRKFITKEQLARAIKDLDEVVAETGCRALLKRLKSKSK